MKCIDIKHTLFHVVLLCMYTDTHTHSADVVYSEGLAGAIQLVFV